MRLNLDAGEHDDELETLWAVFDVLHVACGGHAGDDASMRRVTSYAAAHGIALGAHPSYPDREGFGRRSVQLGHAELAASIHAQCAALAAIARAHGVTVTSVKPHGALYHDANAREPLARALLDGAIDALGRELTVVGPPHGALRDVAAELGLTYAREGFADRGLRPDGSLIPRGEPGALVDDPALAAAQARHFAGLVDTLCVHADTPNALAIARAVREAVRG